MQVMQSCKSCKSPKTARQQDGKTARQRSLGDYSVGVPPLPISNREVKPDSADGTAIVGE